MVWFIDGKGKQIRYSLILISNLKRHFGDVLMLQIYVESDLRKSKVESLRPLRLPEVKVLGNFLSTSVSTKVGLSFLWR